MAIASKMKENKETTYSISPELRTFLEKHMEKGKTVDKFIGAINERSKQYGADVLKLDVRISKLKTQDEVDKLATEFNNLKQSYYEDLTKLVADNVKANFKDMAPAIGVSTLIGIGFGAGVGSVLGAAAFSTFFDGASLASGAGIMGGGLGLLRAGKEGGMLGLSTVELKAIQQLAKEGIMPKAMANDTDEKIKKNAGEISVALNTFVTGFVIGSAVSAKPH